MSSEKNVWLRSCIARTGKMFSIVCLAHITIQIMINNLLFIIKSVFNSHPTKSGSICLTQAEPFILLVAIAFSGDSAIFKRSTALRCQIEYK